MLVIGHSYTKTKDGAYDVYYLLMIVVMGIEIPGTQFQDQS
jgi:hypothetical protein